MNITIDYKPTKDFINVWDYRRDELLDQIHDLTGCSCHHYELANIMPDMTLNELRGLVNELKNDMYYLHSVDDSLDECPEHRQELAELLADAEREDGIK